jgi:His-Xaa-Ser system radical SAM maturase HxsB
MTFLPLRARLIDGRVLCTNDTGRFFASDGQFLRRLTRQSLVATDRDFLLSEGHLLEEGDRLGRVAYLRGLSERIEVPGELNYLILVPTLRCNLSCSYCQVSRAALGAAGFDWSDEILADVLAAIDRLTGKSIKIEFQGGEPTLRLDLLRAVVERAERFEKREFVVCSNLQDLSAEALELFDRPDVYISTSLDGGFESHRGNRTKLTDKTKRFFENLRCVIDRYGSRKVSALPTIDSTNPPDQDALIETYLEYGFERIFLRPINFQGFARKQHKQSLQQGEAWRDYYECFVRNLVARNWRDRSRVLEETYFSICLRRIFHPGSQRHVDLRNPNWLGHDYIVVDYDGRVYPTDEARMLSRSGVIDLAIGSVKEGWASAARDTLNARSSNFDDPACQRCAFQPYCGRDLIDDISRYGRIDTPRHETEFCRRHTHIFDLIFRMIYEGDPAVTYSLCRWLRLDGTPPSLGIYHP